MATIVLSLFAALFFGAADFCGGLATKRTAVLGVAVISQATGFVVLLAIAPFFPGDAAVSDYLWGIAAGACGGLGLALLYHALSIGKMGVISPITAVLGAALPLGAGVLHGEHLSTFQMLGIALALAAIVVISTSSEGTGLRQFSTSGVKEAVASGVLIGGFYLFISYSHPAAGFHGLLAARIASIVFLAAVAAGTRSSLIPRKGTLGLIMLGGAIDMTANALYVLATFNGFLSIAAVLTSLYPAGTVFLARVVLKERLTAIQKAGVGIALVAVTLIALRS
ncbi:MAG: DMT family transporter [Candidatus Eremiobacteraeota bacterium]|nr:DMT family transporter [Candidatus Eremiobacteraeota bacterium]